MNKEKGSLSIESKNIFSILKKWLYTEQDIVFRELVSNASDAIEKRVRLDQFKPTDGAIRVTVDAENSQIIISDNGIGMTEEEVHKYINQIAFSGASEFINTHSEFSTDGIIGHFGVGFYSAFMLCDHVAIETKSYLQDAPPVRWDCRSNMDYEMKSGSRTTAGTDIILHLDVHNEYLKNPKLVYDIIKKYFIFLKTEIRFCAPNFDNRLADSFDNGLVNEFDNLLVNDLAPVWRPSATEAAPETVNTFYKDFFDDVHDPLHTIKFESVDIGLRGMLFLRDTKNGTAELDGTIKVYNRGVYVGDNIKSLIPKFVNLQSGIIECDNLPLVVSRSTMTEDPADPLTSLINETLSQEITIALNDLFENHRDMYEAFWPNMNAFVKYGILQDKTFASVMTRKVIFEDLKGNYTTIKEYIEGGNNPSENVVYYASEKLEQAHYIEIFKKCGLNALLFDHVIDQPFMRRQELVHQNTSFIRIDSNIESLFEGQLNDEDMAAATLLEERIKFALGDRLGHMQLKITRLEHESITTLIINDEKSRRMADMLEIYGMIKPEDHQLKELQSNSTFLVNMGNPIVMKIMTASDAFIYQMIVNQLFDLALMSQGTLSIEHVESFITRSETILSQVV